MMVSGARAYEWGRLVVPMPNCVQKTIEIHRSDGNVPREPVVSRVWQASHFKQPPITPPSAGDIIYFK